MAKHENSVTLYDAGGWLLFYVLFGLPVGTIIDYFWNYAMVTLALWWLRRRARITGNEPPAPASRKRRFLYCLFITLIGLGADILYLYFARNYLDFYGRGDWPFDKQLYGVLLLLVPLAIIWLGNFLISKRMFRLNRRQAVFLGGLVAVTTTPWLFLVLPNLI